jgi:hypothetical protein
MIKINRLLARPHENLRINHLSYHPPRYQNKGDRGPSISSDLKQVKKSSGHDRLCTVVILHKDLIRVQAIISF